jgi:cellulose synthase/poly-beta-1,6-N-acetylglucosamine synthase-like glycosyltransferase
LRVQIIFWLSAFAIFYAYAGYPIFLWLISFFIKAPIKKSNITPSVSLVISAFNEQLILPKKLENALALDYPNDLFEIAAISDGSTDNTNKIIQDFTERSSNVLPCISQQHKGKTACLNDFVPQLKGEIIIFSDANAFYDKDLLRRMVRPFAAPDVGLVTGSTHYVAAPNNDPMDISGLYSRLERLTKSLETKIGSCVGADGAVFAIRKSLFSPLEPDDINDLVIPFHIVSKGYRCILEPSVICTEEASNQANEFQRQIRITNRTLWAIFKHKQLLNPFEYPLFSFKVFSHKIMKFLAPYCLAALLITNVFLALGGGAFYKIMLALQGLFYGCALIGLLQKPEGKKGRAISACYTFLAVNLAYLIGWFKYLKGETYTSWKPQR